MTAAACVSTIMIQDTCSPQHTPTHFWDPWGPAQGTSVMENVVAKKILLVIP